MPTELITVTLDRPRTIRWTNRAEARLGSLDRPPEFRDLAHKSGHKAFYALCAFVWAALVERDLSDWEQVAESLGTPEAKDAAFKALYDSLLAAGVFEQKKKNEPSMTSS